MEIWKDIEGYEGIYQVSNQGRVKSVERYVEKTSYGKKYKFLKKESIRKGHIINQRYIAFDLWKDNECNSFLIHKLVAQAFIPNPAPTIYTIVHHIDHNPHNNCVNNLEWMSEEEHKKLHSKERSRAIYQYDKKTMKLIAIWNKLKDASEGSGVEMANINRCCNNKGYKSAGGFVWSYELK